MRVFFDTSVLVAALLSRHPWHLRAMNWLKRAKSGEIEFLVSTHSLAETYSILSAFPIRPRIPPTVAWKIIQEGVVSAAQLIFLTPAEYAETLGAVADRGLSGGIVFDALLARAARKAGAERLLTFNKRHFQRVWPEGASILLVPD